MTSDNPALLRLAHADAADIERIAALHAASWRVHYRGSLSDAYLDGPVVQERLTFWKQRLEHPRPGQIVLLAMAADRLVGFACILHNHDRTFGSLIDNLHVDVPSKRTGVGRQLMRWVGEALLTSLPMRPVYLFCLEANNAAQRFYERVGGTRAEQNRVTEPDGSEVTSVRFIWSDPASLIAGTQSGC